MKIASLIAAAILLFSSDKSTAQSKHSLFSTWKRIGIIPSTNSGQSNRGIAGPVAGILDDRLLLAGGCFFPDLMPWEGGHKVYTDKGFLFHQDSTEMLQVEMAFQLPEPLAYSTLCNTNNGLVMIGGENANGVSQKTWIIQYNKEKKWVDIKPLPDLPIAVSAAAAVMAGNKIYVAGGENQTTSTANLFMLDLTSISNGWQVKSSIPHAVSHAVLGLTQYQGKETLLLAGGRCKSLGKQTQFYQAAFYYDVYNDQWTLAPNLPYALAAGAGISDAQGSIIIFGGDRGTRFKQVEKLMLAIEQSNDSAKKSILTKRKALEQSSHPGFSREILLYNPKTFTWEINGTLPFQTPVSAVALWWNHNIVLSPGEIRAGVRTSEIFMAAIAKDPHE